MPPAEVTSEVSASTQELSKFLKSRDSNNLILRGKNNRYSTAESTKTTIKTDSRMMRVLQELIIISEVVRGMIP